MISVWRRKEITSESSICRNIYAGVGEIEGVEHACAVRPGVT